MDAIRCQGCLERDQRIVQLERRVAELEARVTRLMNQLEEAVRAGKRQAAPFSKRPPKRAPKKPGRKAGEDYGIKAHRQAPESIDEVIKAPLPDARPDCCGTVRSAAWVVPDETGWRVGGLPAWLHGFVAADATAYVIDPTRSGSVAEALLGLDYAGIMIHDGWSTYNQFLNAEHQQCLRHFLNRCEEILATATRGSVRFPRAVQHVLHRALNLRDRCLAGEVSAHGLKIARARLEFDFFAAILGSKIDPTNERLAQHLRNHCGEIFRFLDHPGLDATNWRAEQAMRFGVILRKIWGGNRTWAGARAQAVLMSVWRTCWQRGRSALNFVSQLLRHAAIPLPAPP